METVVTQTTDEVSLSFIEEQFQFTPTGLVVSGDPTYQDWEQVGRQLEYIQGAVHWWIGDWLNYGERRWGEMYTQAMQDETGFEYQTLADDKWVAGQIEFSSRNENLSFKHHRVVAPLEPEQQEQWLDQAEEEDWSAAELRRQISEQRRIEAAETPLPAGVYDVIYADPPWDYSNSGFKGSANEHYPTMPTNELCALPVQKFIGIDSVLFMWATNPLLEDALMVMKAWGFEYKTNFCWIKNRSTYGKLGFYVFGRHELLLIGIRGSFLPVEKFESVIEVNKSKHSKKPKEVYDIIETIYPNSQYVELFAREHREGWQSFGNEI